MFKCDKSLYQINKKLIQVCPVAPPHSPSLLPPPNQLPLLVPSLQYSFETRVECLDQVGRTQDISVYVVKKGNSIPLITAVIKMPVSESVIVA